MAKKSKIQYGKVNRLPERIAPKDERVRISIVMEGDLLDAIKEQAKESGKPYQTLMKEILRSSLFHAEGPFGSDGENRIREIVREELKKAV